MKRILEIDICADCCHPYYYPTLEGKPTVYFCDNPKMIEKPEEEKTLPDYFESIPSWCPLEKASS